MPAVAITPNSPERQKKALAALLYQQMKATGASKTQAEVTAALHHALTPGSPARIFLLENENRKAIGCCFCNLCVGIESGGNYLWINEIYVVPHESGKGNGRLLLEYVADWAKQHHCRYMMAQTWPKNEASQKLFENCGFESTEVVQMGRRV